MRRDYPRREANDRARFEWVAKKRVMSALKRFDGRKYEGETTNRQVRDAIAEALLKLEGVLRVETREPTVTFNPKTRGFDIQFDEPEQLTLTVTV